MDANDGEEELRDSDDKGESAVGQYEGEPGVVETGFFGPVTHRWGY